MARRGSLLSLEAVASREKDAIDARLAQVRTLRAAAVEDISSLEQPRWPLERAGKVRINVGGRVFFTTSAALTSQPGFFCVLCEGHVRVDRDADGCLFIDRDPTVFQIVLDFLSGRPVRDTIGELARRDLDALILDAYFYELTELQLVLGIAQDEAAGVVCPWSIGAADDASIEELLAEDDKDEPGNENDGTFAVAADRIEARLVAVQSAVARRKELTKRFCAKIESSMCGDIVKLQLQAGDRLFATTTRTLTSQDGPLSRKFAQPELWAGDVDPKDKSVFIDSNSQTFELVLNVLRGYPEPIGLSSGEQKSLAHALDYFGGLSWDKRQLNPSRLRRCVADYGSAVLDSLEGDKGGMCARKLQEWLGGAGLGKVLYRATRDGSDAESFHRYCDAAQQTVVMCRTGKSVFGGFASQSWAVEDGLDHYKEAEGCWLFTLINTHGVEPTRFQCLRSEYAIFCGVKFGPSFGLGRDLVFWYYGTNNCCSNFPQSYEDVTMKGCSLFSGSRRFAFDELEVFDVA